MSQAPSALERNLARLLARAYQPVLPRESFRAQLESDFLARAVRLAHQPVGEPRARPAGRFTVWRAAAGLAAALVVLVGAWWSLRPAESELAQVLARGEVALRRDPAAAWRASSAPSVAFEGSFFEVATPTGRGMRVDAASDRFELERASRAVLSGPPARAALALAAGGLAVERGERGARVEPGEPLAITTSEGELFVDSGRARLAYEDLPGGLSGARGVRVYVERGRARVPAPASPATVSQEWLALLAGDEVLLSGGRVLEPGPGHALTTAALPSAGSRAAAGEPPAPGPAAPAAGEPAGPAPQVRGSVVLAATDSGSAPLPCGEFQVILLHQLALPQVAEPRVFACADAAGRFEVGGLGPGTYAVFVRAPGRALWRGGALELAEGGSVHELEVELAHGMRLEGVVLDDASGLPVAGAVVVSESDAPLAILALSNDELAQGPSLLPLARSGPDGGFVLEDLSPGAHVLRATAPDYGPTWRGPFPLEEAAHVELRLAPGGSVAGLVSDDAGAPLEGGLVILSVTDFGAGHPVMSYAVALTGADGRYRIDDLPEGDWPLLSFGQQGTESLGDPQLAFVSIAAGELVQRDFAAERVGVRLAGTLADPEGRPAPERAVWLTPVEGAGKDMLSTTTDGEGRFEFEGLPPRHFAVFLSRGVPPDMVLLGDVDLRSGADVPGLRLVLGSSSLAGRALDGTSGAPLAHAVVLLLREGLARPEFAGKTSAGEDGRFGFTQVAAGTYEVQIVPLLAFYGVERSSGHALDAGDAVELGDVFLYPGGALEVRATTADGSAAAGAPVELRFEDGRRYFPTECDATDAEGRLRFPGLKAGRWSLAIGGGDFEEQVLEVDVPRADRALIVPIELRRR